MPTCTILLDGHPPLIAELVAVPQVGDSVIVPEVGMNNPVEARVMKVVYWAKEARREASVEVHVTLVVGGENAQRA